MRFFWGACLLLASTCCLAVVPPLRFSIADSWAMPIVEIKHGRPTRGIVHDMLISLANQVGRPAEFHVLARARVQTALERGEIDVRCYTTQSWLNSSANDYVWSIPLFTQRDLLVSTPEYPEQVDPYNLPEQNIGTVLSYTYPSLQPLFDSAKLIRDDARNQEQVLQKLKAGRYHYAVSNQWALDWFNQTLAPQQQLRSVALLQEQAISCMIRNDPNLPVQHVLRIFLKMKISGEIDDIINRYTNTSSLPKPLYKL